MKILISYLALAILLVTFSYALNSQQKLNEQAQSVTSVNSNAKVNISKNDKVSQVSSNDIENSAASAKNLWKRFEAKGSVADK
jgi:hypothetical protein